MRLVENFEAIWAYLVLWLWQDQVKPPVCQCFVLKGFSISKLSTRCPATPSLLARSLWCLSSVWSCATSMLLLNVVTVFTGVLVLRKLDVVKNTLSVQGKQKGGSRSELSWQVTGYSYLQWAWSDCLVLEYRLRNCCHWPLLPCLSTKESTLRLGGVWVCLLFQYLRSQVWKCPKSWFLKGVIMPVWHQRSC